MNREFIGRLAAAVRTRCAGPALTLKALATGIGISADTLVRWLDGRTKVPGEKIGAMARFFARHGDTTFLADVYGAAAAPHGAAPGDRCYWISPAGTLHHAPLGHERFVVEALDADGLNGDIGAHAIRLRGWIRATVSVDGHLTLRLAPARARVDAVERAIRFLGVEAAGVLAGLAIELVTGHQVEVQACDTVPAARRLLERIGAAIMAELPTIVRLDDRRRRLDTAADPAMVAAARFWDGPDADAEQMLGAIGAASGTAHTALFLAEPDGYVCDGLGAALRVDPVIVGRRIEDLFDLRYWRMVSRNYDVTLDEGPTLYEIDAATATDACVYHRAAYPVRRGTLPAILTITHFVQPPQATVLQ